MELKNKNIGIAITGSFCTYEKMFITLEELKNCGANLFPIMSNASQTINSRFGSPADFFDKLVTITDKNPITKIEDAEPFGPKNFLDMMVIFPCTGNTLAKLANGITDTPVLMAAKAHLRNNKPLIISISTNDGLGMNLKNIGLLLNSKNIYFVPFGQDDYIKKPNSLVAHYNLLIPTIINALANRQLQPVLVQY